MVLLSIVVILFLTLEISNVLVLFFNPTFKKANGIGMFNAWEKSKQYPDIHNFIRYMVYWVAGTKIIFIVLLIVILIFGDKTTKLFSVGVLVISIATFFWKLLPLIRIMDRNKEITPGGYSKTLAVTISIFILALSLALIYAIFI